MNIDNVTGLEETCCDDPDYTLDDESYDEDSDGFPTYVMTDICQNCGKSTERVYRHVETRIKKE